MTGIRAGAGAGAPEVTVVVEGAADGADAREGVDVAEHGEPGGSWAAARGCGADQGGVGASRAQGTRKALAQARAMYMASPAAPPFSKRVPATGTSVQQLCFAIVLETHKKRLGKA